MHLEILVEDISGKRMLDLLLPKLIAPDSTFSVHPYRGIGRVPGNMRDTRNASNRILLDNLPKLLKGYGRAFSSYPNEYSAAVLLVCDLDSKNLDTFLSELNRVLDACNPAPLTSFCIAIEEGEAWFLGDRTAIISAFPNAKIDVLNSYEQDTICGTWELLANAIYAGGQRALSAKGKQAVGYEKSQWAEKITPNMEVGRNVSPSFLFFVNSIRALDAATII